MNPKIAWKSVKGQSGLAGCSTRQVLKSLLGSSFGAKEAAQADSNNHGLDFFFVAVIKQTNGPVLPKIV